MSVTGVKSSLALPKFGQRSNGQPDLGHASVGQVVTVCIGSKVADGRYSATIGDKRYVVASDIAFQPGQTLRASVSSLSGTVELKYLGPGQYELLETELQNELDLASAENDVQLAALQERYKVQLSAAERQQVAALANDADNPAKLMMGAFYLNKVGVAVQEAQLRALYQTQAWAHDGARLSAAMKDFSALLKGVQQGDDAAVESLATLLGDACDSAALNASALAASQGANDASMGDALSNNASDMAAYRGNSGNDEDAAALRELASKLLNIQDAGALAYHYGSMPIMIGGQMIELDMVMFRERDSAQSHRAQGLRRLVMTLKTETLGRVEIVAQSIESVLSVSVGTQSAQATELLASHAEEVRDLVKRLGWQVDGVSYRLSTEPARAAEQLVRHVVNAGSLDAVV